MSSNRKRPDEIISQLKKLGNDAGIKFISELNSIELTCVFGAYKNAFGENFDPDLLHNPRRVYQALDNHKII